MKIRFLAKPLALLLTVLSPSYPSNAAQSPSPDEIPSIHVDQLGYLPGMKKVAVLSDPQSGYNSHQSYQPSATLQLVDADTGAAVMELHAVAYNSGDTDPDSGDRVWHADFSAFDVPGSYYILDADQGVRSYTFRIAPDLYTPLLRHTLKTMYYQRCGTAKVGAINDNPCHLGDQYCQEHDGKGGAIEGTEADLSGGWHDAGDFNKYVGYAYPPVMILLSSYLDNPDFWNTFQTGLPEGTNTSGFPDLLDELKWELEWVLKMQKPDGSVRHLVASPSPGYTYSFDKASDDNALRIYEDASGQATCAALSMLAYGAYVYSEAGFHEYAKTLEKAAIAAWNWTEAHPDRLNQSPPNYQAAGVLTASHGNTYGDTSGLAHRFEAACYLHLLTEDPQYLDFVDTHYDAASGKVMLSEDHALFTHNLLAYFRDHRSHPELRKTFLESFVAHWSANNALGAYNHNKTGWSAWGWNGNRSYDAYHAALLARLEGVPDETIEQSERVMSGVLNYIHGTNPLGFAYLTNLGELGGDRYLTRFYHGDLQIKNSPPPGYLAGGPNARYTRSDSPPANQPPLKSFDVTLQAPNSWEYLEGQVSYQSKYIALLAAVIAYYQE